MSRQGDTLLIVPGTDGVVGQVQSEIMGAICRHEFPHHAHDARKTAQAVNRAWERISAASQGTVFSISLQTVNALQDLGLPIEATLDVIEWCWDDLQEAKPRFDMPPDDQQTIAMHHAFVTQVVEALTATYGRLLLRPVSRLRTGIRCAWAYGDSGKRSFRSVLEVAAQLFEVGCTEGQLPVFFRAFTNDALLLLKEGISTGRITREEVLALAQSHGILQAFNPDEVNMLFRAFAETRGRIRPNTLMKTVGAIGLQSAIALHAHTRSPEVACRADAARKAHLCSLNEYLIHYGALDERFRVDFEDYVALTERWAPDILRVVYVTFPSTEILLDHARAGHAETLVHIARAGVNHETLRRFGRPLLDYVRAKTGSTASVAAAAYERCRGDPALADALLAIPEPLHEHPAVRQLLSDGQAVALGDSSLLGMAVVIGDKGLAVDVDLLRAMQRIGSWPQRRNLVRVYGLAVQFMRTGRDADESVREALYVFEGLSPRACHRAMRDVGYFRYHVLGERASPRQLAMTVGTDASSDTRPAGRRAWRRESQRHAEDVVDVTVPSDAATALRTVHHELILSDLVPDRVDPESVAVLILYGLCDLGKGTPFAGSSAIPERHIHANVRRRWNPAEDGIDRAWRWLRSIGIIAHPHGRGNSDVYALDLRSGHRDAIAQELSSRVSAFLYRFRAQRTT